MHEICIRANAKLAVLRSVKYLSRSTLDLLYKIQIRSIIEYGLIIFYNNLKQIDIVRLNRIKYSAAKLTTGALHFTSKIKLNKELAWEDLATRAKILGLSLFHKIHNFETRSLIRSCMSKISQKIV